MVLETQLANQAFLLARIVFGGVLAFMAANHFINLEGVSQYAASKGLPYPTLMTILSGGLLLIGSVGIIMGIYPTISSLAIILFLVIVTPVIHDFWAVPDDMAENEMNHFLKNMIILGAAVAFFALSFTQWEYATTLGLF